MQPRAEQTRQALIIAAAELFDTKGLRDTGLLEISQAAGVSKGALYFHFDSKVDLAAAVWAEARRRAHTMARTLTGQYRPTLRSTVHFAARMMTELRGDPILRAGLRLEAEGGTEPVTQGPTLRQEWLHFLRHRMEPGDGGADLACLLAAVTVGLETLGREDRAWWTQEVMAGLWENLSRLADLPADRPADRRADRRAETSAGEPAERWDSSSACLPPGR